jgi:hypothetical protein
MGGSGRIATVGRADGAGRPRVSGGTPAPDAPRLETTCFGYLFEKAFPELAGKLTLMSGLSCEVADLGTYTGGAPCCEN